jgi:photosystem II stability/assembly factor-like uncharacterized protein
MNTRTVVIACFLLIFGSSAHSQWVQTNGPRNEIPTFSTSDHCLASIGNDLFAGTESSGVLRSTDSGTTWDTVNNGLTDLRVYVLCANGRRLFAGTDIGVCLSTDSGANWDSLPLNSSQVGAIAVSGGNIIVGAVSGSIFFQPTTEIAGQRQGLIP